MNNIYFTNIDWTPKNNIQQNNDVQTITQAAWSLTTPALLREQQTLELSINELKGYAKKQT